LVAGERECVGGGPRFPADIDFDGAHNRGVKTVDDEPEELAHVVLGVTCENLYAFFGGDFLDRADKPERPDDSIAGPHELDQGFPFVEYADIQRGTDHFTLDRGFVKNGVEFVSMRNGLETRIEKTRVAEIDETCESVCRVVFFGNIH
jgi:hypothetical protein